MGELCSTEYSEVCGTEYEQACHTEYAEECWDEPKCWVEEKEECHKVKVHDHQHKQHHKKWKRSVDDEASEVEDMDDKLEDVGEEDAEMPEGEEDAEMPEGEEGNKGEAVAADGSVRKERSLTAVGLGALGAAHLAGAVVGGHIGKKFGFGTGLAVGLGAKKHLNKKDKSVHVKKAHHHAHKKHVHHAHKKPHY